MNSPSETTPSQTSRLSQTTLDNARSALIQARQDVRIARAQLEALIGRDLP